MLLTPKQKERLIGRDKDEFASLKRSNDFLVREALKNFLDLKDVVLILKHLPKDQIEKVVTDRHIDGLLLLAEALYSYIGPGNSVYYEVPVEETRIDGKKPEIVKVSAIDKQRAIDIQKHIDSLNEIKEHREMRTKIFESFELLKENRMKSGFKRKDGAQKSKHLPK
jgi:hypothetical protein